MNAIDGTDQHEKASQSSPPSLLTIVLDTNPHAWEVVSPSLSLFSAVANLLVFINAHLACNNANKVAVIASHCQRTQWLYPTPLDLQHAKSKTAKTDSLHMNGITDKRNLLSDANKYRPFRIIEDEVISNLRHLLATTAPEELSASTSTMTAGALTLALNYINKTTLTTASTANASSPNTSSSTFEPSTTTPHNQRESPLNSRILIVSVSTPPTAQYIPLMNTIFASQRLAIPIDVLHLAGSPLFLQQAADATGGVYLAPTSGSSSPNRSKMQGILQYLLLGFLHDQSTRAHLILPKGENVDFRAACFCHMKVVDVGFVCSICLSIFCEPMADGVCLTCGTQLLLGDYGSVPRLVPKKKKKRRRLLGDGDRDTPTPGPS